MSKRYGLYVTWIIFSAIFIKINFHLDENFANGNRSLIHDILHEIWIRVNSSSGPWSFLIIWLAYRCWHIQKITEIGNYYLTEIANNSVVLSPKERPKKANMKSKGRKEVKEYVTKWMEYSHQKSKLGPPKSVIKPKELLSKIKEDTSVFVNRNGTVSICNEYGDHEIIPEVVMVEAIKGSKLSCTDKELLVNEQLLKLSRIYASLRKLAQISRLQNIKIQQLLAKKNN